VPRIPIVEDLTKEPIPPGSEVLVWYDPASQWYNISLTIAAGWIKSGGVTSYNAYDHPPESVRLQLKRLGLNVERLEREDRLRIWDWYTIQLGKKSQEKYAFPSLKVVDLSIDYSRTVIPGTRSSTRSDVLRVMDDALVLLRYNDEKTYMDFWRTRLLPTTGLNSTSTALPSAPKGVYPEYIYKTFEVTADGIIDVKLEEEGKTTRDLIRIRSMRNVHFDREWHELKIRDNFEVTLE
jgi:KaiC/GvpD/RAD55 family RecA-like ATPase